jgi:hypothetical protein
MLISTAVVGLAVAGVGTATAAPDFDKVTGGGQVMVDADNDGAQDAGPGETIAFNARTTGGPNRAATGQLQYNDHDGVKFHGAVRCLVVNGSTATFAGIITSGEGVGAPFQVDVRDNGEGALAGNDMIILSTPDNADCDPSEDPTRELARGNVQVHDAP